MLEVCEDYDFWLRVSSKEKVGFTEEGYARKYLQINGEWKDHNLFALLSSDNYLKLK